jgi:hypothetical protein
VWIPGLGRDVNGFADQADSCHAGLVPDSSAVFPVVIEQFSDRFPVNGFHALSPDQAIDVLQACFQCNFIAVMPVHQLSLYSSPGFLCQKSGF